MAEEDRPFWRAKIKLKDKFILALDIGTSSVRSALYTMDGDVIPETMVKNERTLAATDDGGAEIDGDEAFRQVCESIDEVFKKCPKNIGDIAYVATSSFWHSIIGVDKAGVPTTKLLGWADTRSRAEVRKLRSHFNEQQIHNATGARFHSSYWPAKLLWLKSSAAADFKRTARWLSLTDHIWFKLFGSVETSISMASATGLFDIRECVWHEPLRKYIGLRRNHLPRIAGERSENVLASEYKKRWPLLAGARWLAPIGDGAANNIGAGCARTGRAAIMIGTSAAMRMIRRSEPPGRIPRGLWCYRVDRQRIVLGGALSDGGGLYQWLKTNFRLEADDDLTENEIEKRPPAAHGIAFMPFVFGERSTGYHENAAGAVVGLNASHDQIDIVQAALESVAYRFAEIFDQLKTICPIKTIVASGGALRESPIWTQIITDVLGREMTLPAAREASSRGAVLLALETIGKIEKLEKIETPKGTLFKPRKEHRKAYNAGRLKHDETYKLLMR